MSRLFKPTLLSLSMLTVMAGAAVAPGLAKIATAFPETNQTVIKLIITLPAVFIIIFSLVSGRLSTRLRKRSILIVGLSIYIVGGIGAGLVNSILVLLAFRALLGIGAGLIMPLSTGLIADFFDGDQRARMMGLSTASSSLGGIIATLAAGVLAASSWRFSFGVYALGIVVLPLVMAYLPEPAAKEKDGGDGKLPYATYVWAAGALFLMMTFYSVPVNLAIFLEENQIGGASAAGLAISLTAAGGFVAGLSLSYIQRLTKDFLMVCLLGVSAVGYVLLSQATVYPLVLLATAISGLGAGWLLPVIFLGGTNAAGKGKGVRAMAVVSAATFLGQFLSPIVLDTLGVAFGNTSARFSYLILAIALSGLFVLALFRRFWQQNSKEISTE
jgi:MFS family permease